MFFLDIFFAYYFTAAMRRIREHRSRDWPLTQGTVYSSRASGNTAYVVYTYVADGEHYTGEHERLFWFNESAGTYAEWFRSGTTVSIRYKPEQLDSGHLQARCPLPPSGSLLQAPLLPRHHQRLRRPIRGRRRNELVPPMRKPALKIRLNPQRTRMHVPRPIG